VSGNAPVRTDGWDDWSIWEHSATVRDLYRKRCRLEAEEMTAHAQAAELLAARIEPGDVVLDAGCGGGYFFHALKSRDIEVEYWGLDASASLIAIGREEMPAHGLAADRLIHGRLEDLSGQVDHVVCLNVISNLDNFHRPLERFLTMARKSVILRESIKQGAEHHYVEDQFLEAQRAMYVHVNHYDGDEMLEFSQSRGFSAELHTDHRTNGVPEEVIGHLHHWTFLVADRKHS
jgi:2-polyprenyl-3-methyl-5-hydroxy-6-metoxy-1,4-benzoquinol methylase